MFNKMNNLESRTSFRRNNFRAICNMRKQLLLKGLCACIFLISLSSHSSEISDIKWNRMKKKAINRKREIIHNNDGCDALYYPRKLKVTKENFIKQRLINAKNTKVNTYSYCPLSSGFGYLTSKTKIGDQLLNDPPHAINKRNVTGELLKMGTDPVKIAEEFCRKNNLEFFISLRCNDTHDQSHHKDKPYFLFPPYKRKHPEYLMGSYTKRPPYCSWSAVDFTHAAVRERFVALAKELISNYSLDCIELDFCRHLQYFKSVAWGKEANPKELKMMTDCIREIRSFAEKTGRQRQHPILIAVRVPDSVEMCKAVGLNLEKWMREGLLDIVIGGFYMQLNPWKNMVDTCHKYGVTFYPSMDESRIRKVERGFNRNTYASDRACIAAALNAGADGIYFFNRYGSQLSNMRGNLDDIRLKNKSYFITYRYKSPLEYLSTGKPYENIKNLSPVTPAFLCPGKPVDYYLDFGDDLNHPDVKDAEPTITVFAITAKNSNQRLQVSVNDIALKQTGSNNTLTIYNAPPAIFKLGLNKVTVSALAATTALKYEKMIMSGDKLLKGRNQAPWRRLFVVHDFPSSEKIVDGAYRISDTGTGGNEMANLLYPLINIEKEFNVRFQAKVESSTDNLSAVCRIANGKNIEIITLQPNRIGLYFAGKSVPFKTTNTFHSYEAIMKNGNLILKVDGKKLFNTPLTMKADNPAGYLKNSMYRIANMNRQSLLFGSLSGRGTGAVLWKNIRFVKTNDGLQLEDLKFDVIFPKTKHLNKYLKISPKWKFNFNVADAILHTYKNVKYHYKKTNMLIVDGDKGTKSLRLTHLKKGYQTIIINDPDLTQKGSGLLLAEWKMKYLDGVEGKSGFYVVFKPMNQKKQGLLCNLQFFSDKIIAPWGTINLKSTIKNNWTTFRIVIDVKNDVALLWMNGNKIGSGKVPSRKKMKSGIFFGDGSSNVAGQAEVEYFKITTLN